ncbi:MAG: trypsin-like peptidase domain-containing protein [Planctomycetota bacterium]
MHPLFLLTPLAVALLGAPASTQQPAPSAPATSPAAALQRERVALVRKVRPSVVTLRAYRRAAPAVAEATADGGWTAPAAEATYPGFVEYAACSGFVVSQDGEVLAVQNLLRDADGELPDLIDLELHDHQRVIAELVGSEPTVNLAIVQATVFPNGHSRQLVPLAFGDSDQMLPGMEVLCIGDPSGPERFCTFATFVTLPERDCYQDLMSAFYQQIATVVPDGAYGGPVVDYAGNVVGVLAPRDWQPGAPSRPRTGLELALPSKIVKTLHAAIRDVKSFRSPWFGFAVMSRPEIAAVHGTEYYTQLNKPRTGILVENVFEPSPAKAAGVQPGDFLVGFGDTRIFTPVDFQRCLYLTGVGGKARLELWRAGEKVEVELMVEERPATAVPR